MRILITGGGGYLGTVLVRQLLASTTHHLTILDRFDHGVQPLASLLTPDHTHQVTLRRGDVADGHAVEWATRGMDLIVHLAGIVGYPACDAHPQDAERTNVEGTAQVCSFLTSKTRRIIFASTGSCYGKVETQADEETPVSPLTRYGRTKAEGEQIIRETGVGIVLRFATLYGLSPRMRWDLLPNDFVRSGVRGSIQLFEPDARRTFLHVEDAARAIKWAIDGELLPGVWNVGDDAQNWTKFQLAQAVQSFTSCSLTTQDGYDPDQRNYAVSYHKITRAGFVPFHSLLGTLPGLVKVAKVWE